MNRLRRLRASRLEQRRQRTDARRKAALKCVKYNPSWEKDPVLFALEALGIVCWGRQAELLRAVASHRRVAVKSGHKVGKSTSAVILALWYVVTRPQARVIMTSSSGRQVRSILWKELRRVYHRASYEIGGKLHKVPDAGLQFDDGREILGFSTDEPEKMAGFSGDILFIVDEASGVPEVIFEAIEGNRAGGATIVLFSNPTQTSGTFYDAFTSKRHLWHPLTISSEETPNVVEGRTVIPNLAGREWIDEKKLDWGVESPLYQVRIRGNFPLQGSNAVVSLGLVETSQRRWRERLIDDLLVLDEDDLEDDGADIDLPSACTGAALDAPTRELTPDDLRQLGPLEFGVDPARFGEDSSVIAPRRGKRIFELRAFTGLDGVELAHRVVETIRALRIDGDPLPKVKVDVVGLGASCADALRHHRGPHGERELILVEVNSAENATTKEHHRLRDQLWFGVTDWLKEGGELPPDDKLARDLVAPTYSFDPQSRYLVEPKRETKARLGNSPDRADAVALAIFQGDTMTVLVPRVPRPTPRFGGNARAPSRGFAPRLPAPAPASAPRPSRWWPPSWRPSPPPPPPPTPHLRTTPWKITETFWLARSASASLASPSPPPPSPPSPRACAPTA